MRRLFFLLFGFYFLISGVGNSQTVATSTKIKVDKSSIAIIPFQQGGGKNLFINAKPTQLSDVELENIEEIMQQFMVDWNIIQEHAFYYHDSINPNHYKKEDFIVDLKNYYRQYVAVINENNEKEVWISCFCKDFFTYSEDPQRWRTEIIQIDDGGNCVFNLKINITKRTYYDFYVNGDA